jgi:hypothetical protein
MLLSQRHATHPPQLPAAEEDRPGVCCSLYHADSHVSRWWRVPEGPDPCHPQRPRLHPAMGPGGVGEQTTTSQRDGLCGTTSDPRQRQPRSATGRRATPRGTPSARDLRLEFEEAGLPTFNSPQDNLGAAMARLQQANLSPEAEAAMAELWVATALVEEKSAASKSAASSSSQHSRSRSN